MITKAQAMTCHMFYHVRARNADGTAARCRANGRCKTWKTRPDEWKLPVKHGLKDCFYLTPENADDWTTEEPVYHKVLCSSGSCTNPAVATVRGRDVLGNPTAEKRPMCRRHTKVHASLGAAVQEGVAQ